MYPLIIHKKLKIRSCCFLQYPIKNQIGIIFYNSELKTNNHLKTREDYLMKILTTTILFVLFNFTTLFSKPTNQPNHESCCGQTTIANTINDQKTGRDNTNEAPSKEEKQEEKPAVSPKDSSSPKAGSMNEYQRMDRGRKVLEYKYKLYA